MATPPARPAPKAHTLVQFLQPAPLFKKKTPPPAKVDPAAPTPQLQPLPRETGGTPLVIEVPGDLKGDRPPLVARVADAKPAVAKRRACALYDRDNQLVGRLGEGPGAFASRRNFHDPSAKFQLAHYASSNPHAEDTVFSALIQAKTYEGLLADLAERGFTLHDVDFDKAFPRRTR